MAEQAEQLWVVPSLWVTGRGCSTQLRVGAAGAVMLTLDACFTGAVGGFPGVLILFSFTLV